MLSTGLVNCAVVEKSTVEKSTVEKSTLEKSTVKKSTVEKSTVEKSSVEKSTVEKSIVEESTLKKSTVKKSTVEKSTVEWRESRRMSSAGFVHFLVRRSCFHGDKLFPIQMNSVGCVVGARLCCQQEKQVTSERHRVNAAQFKLWRIAQPNCKTLSLRHCHTAFIEKNFHHFK